MTVAVVIAGGVGSRMGANIPKQFVLVEGKPVLFYTLDAFERHPQVDAIELVLIDGWESDVEAWKAQYGVTKLKWIVKGGASGQESIRNGVFGLEGKCKDDDIVIIHDGIRPLVEPEVLDDVISKAKECGTKVVFDLPKGAEAAGFSPAMLARMDATKAKGLGWRASKAIKSGIAETLAKLRDDVQ